jgi:2-polyprenyl-6-methoxyphenol hydroxylase-like FAD-dependent oxidoreductase
VVASRRNPTRSATRRRWPALGVSDHHVRGRRVLGRVRWKCLTQSVVEASSGEQKGAVPIGPIYRFGFSSSVRRRFEALDRFPDRVLSLGDVICRFNPAFGQGMSVAAQEVRVLKRLIEARALDADPLKGLARSFFAALQDLLAAPWAVAESDFIFEKTRGQRRTDFCQRLKFNSALQRVASEDATVHQLMSEVAHLVKPSSALRDPQIISRVTALIAASA